MALIDLGDLATLKQRLLHTWRQQSDVLFSLIWLKFMLFFVFPSLTYVHCTMYNMLLLHTDLAIIANDVAKRNPCSKMFRLENRWKFDGDHAYVQKQGQILNNLDISKNMMSSYRLHDRTLLKWMGSYGFFLLDSSYPIFPSFVL